MGITCPPILSFGQGDVDCLGDRLRVLAIALIKIPHAHHQQHAWALHARHEILLHQGSAGDETGICLFGIILLHIIQFNQTGSAASSFALVLSHPLSLE